MRKLVDMHMRDLTGMKRRLGVMALAVITLLGATQSAAAAAAPTQPPIDVQGVDDGLSATVRASTSSGHRLYLGGSFTSAGGQSHTNAVAINMNTQLVDHGWDVTTNGRVHAMIVAPDGSGIYIGGDFTSVNGVGRNYIAKVDVATGALLPTQITVNNSVYAFATHADRLYIGGRFSSVNGTNHRRLVAMVNDQIVTNWFANADVSVRDIKLTSDGVDMYIAGSFTAVDGSSATERVAKIRAADGERLTWNPQVNNGFTVIDLAISEDDQTVYMATGDSPGNGGNRTKAVSASNGSLLWQREHGGDPQALLEHDGILYIGGHFTLRPGFVRARLMAVDSSNGAILPWEPTLNSNFGVWELDASPWGLVVAGDFTLVDGLSRRHVAVYDQVNFGLNTNQAPSLVAIADQSDPVGANVSLQLSASDPDNDPLSWSGDQLPPGLALNNSGLISGSPTQAGLTTTTVTVTDPGGLSASRTFTWTVSGPNAGCTVVLNAANQPELTWDAVPGENTYAMRRNGVFITSVTNTLTWTDTTAPTGTHSYISRARVNGVVTNLACGSVTVPPGAGPTCSVVLNGANEPVLTWDPVPGENTYAMRRNGVFITSVTNTLTWTDTTAPTGTHSYISRARVNGVVTNLACGSVTVP